MGEEYTMCDWLHVTTGMPQMCPMCPVCPMLAAAAWCGWGVAVLVACSHNQHQFWGLPQLQAIPVVAMDEAWPLKVRCVHSLHSSKKGRWRHPSCNPPVLRALPAAPPTLCSCWSQPLPPQPHITGQLWDARFPTQACYLALPAASKAAVAAAGKAAAAAAAAPECQPPAG